MADQKYSNKYQKHWGVPKINLVAGHGRSPLYDVRASYGDKKTTGAQTPLQHASPTVLSNGRMQPSTPAGGIVTRSKLNAQGTSRECVSPSPSREDPRNGDRVDQDERVKAEIQQESLEKMTSPVVNQRGTPVCSEAGKCQGGGELRLSSLAEMSSNIDVPSSYALVGCKSPLLPGIMLVAAVDKRYLPDEETSTTMLGFSGNCIGCGAKGFRYFTEYSQHINLRLATQPKKQKHMKYYIIKDSSGRLRKGNIIPWRVEGRKRSMPLSGSFVVLPDEDTPNDQSSVSMVSGPPVLSQYPQATPNSNNGDTLTVTSYQPPLVAASYSGPPSAKRHRWESGSDSETVYVEGENTPASCSTQDTTRVEFPNKPWLTTACGVCPVLLLCQHSIPNVPCSVHDIIVSDLLVGCFDPPQVSDLNQFGNFTGAYNTTGESFSHPSRGPSGQSRYYQSTLSPLTTQMAILLMIQYLSQFDEDDRVMREEVESLLQDAQLELSAGYQNAHILAQSNLLTHVQLPILANLAAVPSKGRVKIVTSPVTLENAIVRGLKFIMDIIKHNQSKFPKVPMPDYIFLLSTSQKKAPEFCVLISGVNQARYLTEAMIGHPVGARITDNVAKLEQLFRLSSDALEQLVSSYEEAMCHDGKLVYVPFNGFARMKVLEEEALKLEPKVTITSFQHYGQKNSIVYSTQNQIAKQLVSQVCSIAENSSSLDVNRFVKVDLVIIVPPITTLFNQTVQRLADSNVLADLELEDDKSAMSFEAGLNYVIKHDDDDDSQEKLSSFLKNVQLQPTTLFILIFDQAQFYSKPRGVLDLPFYKEFLEASNVIPLFVTSAPYLFQTNYSFIDPENEVYWTDSRTDSDSSSVTSTPIEDDQYIDDQDSMYFGLKEYCDSIKWTHQFPLFRQDDAFERMALRTTSNRRCQCQCPPLLPPYSPLLCRHYVVRWYQPAEPHCTLKTIQIIREIIESPLRNADGSGSMLAIRIPSVELAMMAYESLKVIRDRLGFQYRFAVIHDNGMGELEIEEYFLKRLRFCKAQRGLLESNSIENWHPICYEELLDLPCIILLSGRERTGETFPRSLKYIDIRLIDRGFLYRSSLELEFSAIACYISTGAGPRNTGVEGSDAATGDAEDNKDDSSTSSAPTKTSHYSSNYPLPVILVSRSAFKAFQTDFYGYPKHLLLPTTPQTRWIGHGRPHLVTSNPANQSLYYRKWTEPKPSNLVGTQCSNVNSRTVISMRSASGIVISPDISDVVEEDGMSAVETMTETPRQSSVAGSETEDNGADDSKPNSPYQKNNTDERETKTVRIAQDTKPNNPRPIPTPKSNASESDTEAGAMVTTDDESDNEAGGVNKYHPRSILFSGLPQVGKTGAYLHFARLLHRMLIKLQKVDVYDEIPLFQTSTSDSKETASKSPQSERPEFKVISQIPFNSELKGYQFAKASPLLLYSSKKEPHPSTTKKDNTSQIKDSPIDTRPVTSVLLSSWAAHDICHHCDSCKVYRDGIGPSTSLYHTYQLESGEHLHFLIPPTHVSEFTFTDDKQLRSLRLTKVLHVLKGVNGEVVTIKNEGELSNKPAIKSPIMIPSTGRHESGLFNLYHTFEGENHIQLVFVKHQEMPLYNKMWPNHIIVGLPKECDNEGIGAARHFIKEFATQNFFKERLRQGVDGSGSEDIWPMMLMMDDSCVLWQNLLQHSSSPPEEDSKDKEGTSIPFNANSSLLKVMKAVESIPDITKYGAIGFSHFSSKTTHMTRPSFSHTLLNTAVVLNLPALKKLQYSRNKYSCEDLDFSLLMHSHGTPTFRFDHLTVAKKSIESGGQMAIKLFINSSESSIGTGGNSRVSSVNVNDYSNFVTAPDTDDTHYFSAPAQYLLERYLAEGAALKLFKTAADKPDHPIVIIDNYVNLGPRLTVEYVSTVSMKERKLRTKGSEKNKSSYGGLLLYFSGQAVTKELLQQFQFVDDAQLCLVCQDRNTLRQEVVRLDLEENWRFRLRDELQTANDPDDPSLFLLTGTHE